MWAEITIFSVYDFIIRVRGPCDTALSYSLVIIYQDILDVLMARFKGSVLFTQRWIACLWLYLLCYTSLFCYTIIILLLYLSLFFPVISGEHFMDFIL